MKGTALKKHAQAVFADNIALVNGYKCPSCFKEFSNQYSCPHGWDDVIKANLKHLKDYINLKED